MRTLRSRAALLALLVVLAGGALAFALSAEAATAAGPTSKPGSSKGEGGGKKPGGGKGGGKADVKPGGKGGGGDQGDSAPAPASPSSSGADQTPPSLGTVSGLSIRNPLCDKALRPGQDRNCKRTGSPEARYPTSNYGLEIHIETGLTHIKGNFQSLLATVANAIWMGVLFVLNLVLSLLGFAFSLNPFGDGHTMREISTSLERFYRVFTSPWLVVAFVSVGVWGVYKGLVKREIGASIAGMAVSVALMVLGLIVLHEPRATVGTAAGFSNDAAQAVIGAPLQGTLDNPPGSYAAATAETWRAMTLPGFAALNFSDIGWALSRPDKDLLAYANKNACVDYQYLDGIPKDDYDALMAAIDAAADSGGLTYSDSGSIKGGAGAAQVGVDCSVVAEATGQKIPYPETNAEIWLRNSSGSVPRDELWDHFHEEMPYANYLSIQGDGGAWSRLPLVVVIALGLLGGILLLSFLAIKLLSQTAIAFVLLLSAPIALFMPAFGERGRSAFVYWATTLVGALLSKVIYAALLAIVLAATSVASSLAGDDGGIGTMAAFLVSSGLWWAIFLKRDTLLAFISISGSDGDRGSALQSLVGLRAAQQMGGGLAGAPLRAMGWGAKAGAAAAGGAAGDYLARRGDSEEGARSVAENQLDRAAEGRLDGQFDEAQDTIAAHHADGGRLREIGEQHAATDTALRRLRSNPPGDQSEGWEHEAHQSAIRSKQAELGELDTERRQVMARVQDREPSVQRAKAVVGAANANEAKGGSRWSAAQVKSTREALRQESDLPVASPAHAWRAGMSAEQYGSLQGAERDVAHSRVSESLRRDRVALGTISDRPPGLAGEPPPTDPAGARRMRKEIRSGGDQAARQEFKNERDAHRAVRRDKPRRGESAAALARRAGPSAPVHRRPSGPSRRGVGGR